MNLQARLKRLEQAINRQLYGDNMFPGWSRDDLLNYAKIGVIPPGRHINHRADWRNNNSFAGWSKEELLTYAQTGEYPTRGDNS